MMKKFFLLHVYLLYVCPIFCANCQSLVEHSPFHPHKQTKICPSDASNESKNFELHGIFLTDGKTVFSIHDKSKNKNFWLDMDGEYSGIKVKNFYPDAQMVELMLPNGEVCLLRLKAARSSVRLPRYAPNPSLSGRVVDEWARRRFFDLMRQRGE